LEEPRGGFIGELCGGFFGDNCLYSPILPHKLALDRGCSSLLTSKLDLRWLGSNVSEFGGMTIACRLRGTLTSFGIGEFLFAGSFRGENLFLIDMMGGGFVDISSAACAVLFNTMGVLAGSGTNFELGLRGVHCMVSRRFPSLLPLNVSSFSKTFRFIAALIA